MVEERRVVVVGYDGAELLDIASVTSTLQFANWLGTTGAYRTLVVSPAARPITCQSGLVLQVQQSLERTVGPLDTLVVSGGISHEAAADDARLTGHVRRLARESRRVASVCTGATILAATGLLDGRRATTHWEFAGRLGARRPAVLVDPDPIYIRDGHIATSAGVTSALDLTLAFVAEDHGPDVARRVARNLVTYLQRPGNQAQMSMHVAAPPPEHDLVRSVTDHITAHLNGELSVERLADHAGVSARHLARLFLDHLGITPGRFVRRTRTEAAALLLTSTPLPMAGVATRCGFGSAEALRQAFVAHYGTSPSRYRASQAAL